jgi:hypothetical protein
MVSREHTITMPEAVVIALPREAWNHRELFAKAVPESRYGVKRCAAILAVFRPLWICRVRREKVFVHCGFAEGAAKKFSSIVDLQSTPRKKIRPLQKVFPHCSFAKCAATISRSTWTVKRSSWTFLRALQKFTATSC